MSFIKEFFITFLIFFSIDLLWLSVIAQKLYSKYLGYLMAEKINWLSAIIFYIIFIIGIIFFVVRPSLDANNLKKALLGGALFGFVCYATYDLTNLATIKNWPVKITLIDLCWGSFVTGLTSVISFLVIRHFSK